VKVRRAQRDTRDLDTVERTASLEPEFGDEAGQGSSLRMLRA